MKYAIVIPDGCADEPQASLGGKTPLQAARKPNMDRIARLGVVGRTDNVPPTLTPASDVATLSLFGYDPLEVYTGRAPLETAAMGLLLGPGDWAIRCNLVHVEAPDEASHEGKADAKVRALEEIDRHIVGPLLEALPGHGDWRILVSPDHRTTLRTRAHAYGMVPFAVAGTGITADSRLCYDELQAESSDLVFAKGHRLMPWFLGS